MNIIEMIRNMLVWKEYRKDEIGQSVHKIHFKTNRKIKYWKKVNDFKKHKRPFSFVVNKKNIYRAVFIPELRCWKLYIINENGKKIKKVFIKTGGIKPEEICKY